MQKKPTLGPAQLQNYYRAHDRCRDTILASIDKLRSRNRQPIDAGEKAVNDNEILSFKGDLHLHDAKKTAFDAENAAISPPTAAQLENLKTTLAKVEALTAEGRIAEEAVALVKDGVRVFEEIQPSEQ